MAFNTQYIISFAPVPPAPNTPLSWRIVKPNRFGAKELQIVTGESACKS
jgi:hypothetical protein